MRYSYCSFNPPFILAGLNEHSWPKCQKLSVVEEQLRSNLYTLNWNKDRPLIYGRGVSSWLLFHATNRFRFSRFKALLPVGLELLFFFSLFLFSHVLSHIHCKQYFRLFYSFYFLPFFSLFFFIFHQFQVNKKKIMFRYFCKAIEKYK